MTSPMISTPVPATGTTIYDTLTPTNSTRSRGEEPKRAESGKWPIGRLYTKQHRRSFLHLGSEGGSADLKNQSNYLDYIPYKDPRDPKQNHQIVPPVPALPSSSRDVQRRLSPSSNARSGKTSPVTPPPIAGLDSTAERWLQENTYIGQPRPSSGRSMRSQLSRGGHSVNSNSCGDHDDPVTGDIETYEIMGVTHTAVNARRSIARLWPSRDAVPSLYRSNTLIHTRGPEAVVKDITLRRSNTLESYGHSTSGMAFQTVPVSASASATAGIGTIDSFTSSFIRPAPLKLLTATSSASPQPSGYTPSSRNRPQTPLPLRRGVSIKSAKTVRSFFSGWIKATPGSGNGHEHHGGGNFRPDTPARPQTAARPDSGIFPLSLSLGLGTVDVPLSHVDRDMRGLGGDGDGGSRNMFIELNPSSPLTASRPASEWQGKRSKPGSVHKA